MSKIGDSHHNDILSNLYFDNYHSYYVSNSKQKPAKNDDNQAKHLKNERIKFIWKPAKNI